MMNEQVYPKESSEHVCHLPARSNPIFNTYTKNWKIQIQIITVKYRAFKEIRWITSEINKQKHEKLERFLNERNWREIIDAKLRCLAWAMSFLWWRGKI
jgi:hypothetical protein